MVDTSQAEHIAGGERLLFKEGDRSKPSQCFGGRVEISRCSDISINGHIVPESEVVGVRKHAQIRSCKSHYDFSLRVKLCLGGLVRCFITFDFDNAAFINQTCALAHHVIDEMRSAITVPRDIAGDIAGGGVADSGFVIPEA